MKTPRPSSGFVLFLVLAFAGGSLVSCAAPAGPPERVQDEVAENEPAGFVNRVWMVGGSPTITRGQIYVFLSEGTLVIASSTGTPAFGKWTYEGGALTMIEEGIPYKVDILGLSQDEFRIRMNNPGEPVTITLVPADTPPVAK